MGALLITATCGVGVGTAGVGDRNSFTSVGDGMVMTGVLVSVGFRVLLGVGRSGVEVNAMGVSVDGGAGWLWFAEREGICGALGGIQYVDSAPNAPPVAQDTLIPARSNSKIRVSNDLRISVASALHEVIGRVPCKGFHLLLAKLKISVILTASADGDPTIQSKWNVLVSRDPLPIIPAGQVNMGAG